MRVTLSQEQESLTERIIGAAFQVSASLGHGFLEAVYRKAMIVGLRQTGMNVEEEVPFTVRYLGAPVGTYLADLCVESQVLVELNSVAEWNAAHRSQVVNYLRASGLPVGLLINFGQPKVEVRRVLA
ncbi:conserved hypothetical protein [Magnetospirillum sp. LM-5]|uniref:GxxExxY protein n=1 Tax=Magnetospirillum sp. LM-5 TaxID=2681466 RepID=UPI001382A176|nr:GxxExxY protein [Magnetospirillum sp. LM-5]CAA7618352.1 conserved hypothetical protein [Magnetospirillum sp. LM-5]